MFCFGNGLNLAVSSANEINDMGTPDPSPYTLLQQLTGLVGRYAGRGRPWRLEAFLLWALGQPEAGASSVNVGARAQPLAPEATPDWSPRVMQGLGPGATPEAGPEREGSRSGPAQPAPGSAGGPRGSAFAPVAGYAQVPPASEIGRLIGGLYKRMRHNARQQMQGQPVSNMDDFALLASLLVQPGLKKTDLIALNHLELSSGSDSIARRVRAGLVAEGADPTDRRVRKLTLTEAGRAAIYAAFAEMGRLAEALLAPLTGEEVATLHGLLSRVYASSAADDATD
jgi:DNA-binding MarR family transcriptional regulator